MRSVLMLLLLTSLAVASPITMDFGKGDVAIAYDPTQPNEKISIVWLSYCIGRLDYVVEHRSQYPKKISGELTPKFKEEVAGRSTALDTYKNMVGKKLDADDYWEAVQKISNAGFLEEYVWTFLYQKTWPESEKPAKLAEFTDWIKTHLKHHKPLTYGALVGKKK